MPDSIKSLNPDYLAGRQSFSEGGSMREAFNRSITNPDGDHAFMIGFSDGILDAMRRLIDNVSAGRPNSR